MYNSIIILCEVLQILEYPDNKELFIRILVGKIQTKTMQHLASLLPQEKKDNFLNLAITSQSSDQFLKDMQQFFSYSQYLSVFQKYTEDTIVEMIGKLAQSISKQKRDQLEMFLAKANSQIMIHHSYSTRRF